MRKKNTMNPDIKIIRRCYYVVSAWAAMGDVAGENWNIIIQAVFVLRQILLMLIWKM